MEQANHSREEGQISIQSEHIFPIIKRWLYSDREIFIRELVSNASDALFKLDKMRMLGQVADEKALKDPAIQVFTRGNQLVIEDTGIGLSADEVKRYINQVAYSGIRDFAEKYQSENAGDQIIGHFGLGFYSSFMVAEKVEIWSQSQDTSQKSIHWESETGESFKLELLEEKRNVGTQIILHLNEESKEFAEEERVRHILEKYCSFFKYPVLLNGKKINEKTPIWLKNPTELKDEDYKEFYRSVFPFSPEPLFWVHIQLDYPFQCRAVLFFPKINRDALTKEGEVKLFCNQVFVEDNCKELLPEYLMLLKGVVDCPDLPLNVSRSALQRDAKVIKLSSFIVKKVADKINGLFKTQRKEYESFWADIGVFVKFAMLRDEKFLEKTKDSLLFKSMQGNYFSPKEYIEKFGDKTNNELLYTSQVSSQRAFINMLEQEGIDTLICDHMVDQHFLPYYEMQAGGDYKFKRVDSEVFKNYQGQEKPDIVDPATNEGRSDRNQKTVEVFKKHLAGMFDGEVEVITLKDPQTPALLVADEQARRSKEMFEMMNQKADIADRFQKHGSGLVGSSKLILNEESGAVKTIQKLLSSPALDKDRSVDLLVKQVFDLARMQSEQFGPEDIGEFVSRSSEIIAKMGGHSLAI